MRLHNQDLVSEYGVLRTFKKNEIQKSDMLLFDESHNEFCTVSGIRKRRLYSRWKEAVEKYGLTYVRSRKEFKTQLREAHTIVMAEPHSYCTLKETLSLIDFVLNGRSLILIGNHHNLQRYYSYGCNEILNVISVPFGIRFNTDEIFFHRENVLENFAEHPICQGVKNIHYWRGCSLTVLRHTRKSLMQEIAVGSRHDTSDVYRKAPVAAAVYEGKGKIFCLGDSSVWSDPREPVEDDNFLFAENVIKWAL